MENASISKRVIALIIDVLILGLVITTSLKFFTNNEEVINSLNDQMSEINSLFIDEKIDLINYLKIYSNLVVSVDKYEVLPNMLNCIYIIFLFIYIPFFFKGQTIGMKFAEIKIVKENGDNANLWNFTCRCLIFYSLGYLIITLSLLYLVPSLYYFITSLFLIFLEFLLVIISVFMIIYRHDRKGLHDILTKTKVVKV